MMRKPTAEELARAREESAARYAAGPGNKTIELRRILEHLREQREANGTLDIDGAEAVERSREENA